MKVQVDRPAALVANPSAIGTTPDDFVICDASVKRPLLYSGSAKSNIALVTQYISSEGAHGLSVNTDQK